MISQIPRYWQLPIVEREQKLSAVKQADLEAYADEHQLIIHNGKLIKPEDYPCLCQLEGPHWCFEDPMWKNTDIEARKWTPEEKEAKECHCPCHQYWEA